MKLKDCVEFLSTKTLSKILSHHVPYTLEEESSRQLAFLLDPAYLAGQWKQMEEGERKILRFFFSNARKGMIPLSQLENGIPGLTKVEISCHLTRLRQKGFIFTHRRLFGEVSFFIPDDLRLALVSHCFFQDGAKPPLYPSPAVPSRLPAFLVDLFSLLRFVKNQPLQLTQKGTIHRRFLGRLQEGMEMGAHHFQEWPLRYDEPGLYSAPLALLLDFSIYLGFLAEREGALHVQGEQWEKWLSLSREGKMEQILGYLQQRVAPFLSDEAALFLDLLPQIPTGGRFQLEEMFRSISAFLGKDGRKAAEEILKEVAPLHLFGLIVIENEDGALWAARLAIREDAAARVYVQPDLQILVPSDVPDEFLWKIGMIARLRHSDQMSIYEISREAVEAAVEEGWDEKGILSFLEKISVAVPENVKAVIRSWVESYGKVQFLDCILLQCRSAELADEICRQPAFQPFIAGRLSPVHLIVVRKSWREFQEMLAKAGYSPLKTLLKPGDADGGTAEAAAPILKAPETAEPRVENVYPEWSDCIPGLHSVPRAWFDHYRTYHPSTLVDLLKKSAEYGFTLTFDRNGERMGEVLPVAVVQLGGKLVLQAKELRSGEEFSVPVEEIGQVRAHLPGM